MDKPLIGKLPAERPGITHKFRIYGTDGPVKGYVTVNFYPETEQVAEIFVTLDSMGSQVRGSIDSWAIQFSKRLQEGALLEEVVKDGIGVRYPPEGKTDTPGIRFCSSPVDYICRYLKRRFVEKKPLED